jgi:hypothetical protein
MAAYLLSYWLSPLIKVITCNCRKHYVLTSVHARRQFAKFKTEFLQNSTCNFARLIVLDVPSLQVLEAVPTRHMKVYEGVEF